MACYVQRLAAVVLSMVSRGVLRTEIGSCCVRYGITCCVTEIDSFCVLSMVSRGVLQRLAAVVLSMVPRGVFRTEIGSCCVKYGITWCFT